MFPLKHRLNDFMSNGNKITIPAQARIQIKPKAPNSCFRRNNSFSFLCWGSIFFGFIFISFNSFTSTQSQTNPASAWHLLYPQIRDGLISKEKGINKLKKLEALLKEFYLKNASIKQDDRLCFPLKGYGPHAIGGKEGEGYQTQGYDFFDGNQHRGHPGHDIFIRDKNQDGLDDLTGKPVGVISASSGVVVSVNLNWEPQSPIRGGNYIWIYEPIKSRYFYYAHLNEIFVKVGQVISRGDRLGTAGRTGTNAYLKRSPTHLHFTVHESIDGYPKPVNPYSELIKNRDRK
jgi:murein DD-endopeptidase MepM/ murein hydrolase activator NlpD